MPGPSHTSTLVYDVIHFADHFPVVAAPCGKRGPAADLWRYVTCVPCLDAGPDDPRIRERRRAVVAEAEAKRST